MQCKNSGQWQGGQEDAFCERDWDTNPFEGSCEEAGDVICGFRAQFHTDQERTISRLARDPQSKTCQFPHRVPISMTQP